MINFKSRVARKILNYFFLNEKIKVYINDLARQIEDDPKNVYRILLYLEEMGILNSEFIGKERFFYANKKNSLYKEYKNIFLKTAGLENLLKMTIRKIDDLQEAYIYGSYANNRYKQNSDIDVLLIGKHNVLIAQRLINKIQKNISREINVTNMSIKELNNRKRNKDQFVRNVFRQKMIKLL